MSIGLIFDIDGTLVTFKFDVQGTRSALLSELTEMGFATAGLTLASPTQKIMDSVRDQVRAGSVSWDYPSARDRLYSILDRFEEESSRTAVAFPDTVETLRLLREQRVKLAVLTNSGRRSALPLLAKYSLAEFFDFVLTRDDVDAMKPSPDGIHKALSLMALPKRNVYYVGDSPYDIMAAKRAELKVISVATGNYDTERLKAEGADIVVESLRKLPDALPL
jgi:HAD superfamily hydrolase (TIGR01549 family)